jgi:3-hydroxybutyryl-CoA dehydrogenase
METISVSTLGVVGTGAMGRGIAQLFAQAGQHILMLDTQPEAAQAARHTIFKTWQSLLDKGRITAEQQTQWSARLEVVESVEALARCEVVVEAIIERLDIKQQLIAQLESHLSEQAIIASNTSSLSITAMAAQAKHPARVAGFHFFNPVPLMKVVEVIQGAHTARLVVDTLMGLAQSAGHTAVLASDMPGFIVNHAGRGYGTEALKLVAEGVADFANVDHIMREQVSFGGLGFRMGPFELMDLTGLDVSHPVMESIYQQFYDEPRFRPSALAAQRLAGRVLGRKTSAGFYRYDAQGKVLDAALPAPGPRGVLPASVWIEPLAANSPLAGWCRQQAVRINPAPQPDTDDLLILTPEGHDLSQHLANLGLQSHGARAIAIDTFFDPLVATTKRRTLMRCPATSAEAQTQATALFTTPGVQVSWCEDSIGFVAPRIICMVIAIGCEIAQQGIAKPQDIDAAVRLGLGYPMGPLAMGDQIGPSKVMHWLSQMEQTSGDPRYRPSLWLRRRAQLGLSLLQP